MHFLPIKEENLYYSKKWPKIVGPKKSVIERFHCSNIVSLLLTLAIIAIVCPSDLLIVYNISCIP